MRRLHSRLSMSAERRPRAARARKPRSAARRLLAPAALALGAATGADAQSESGQELALELANPVANLISVPLQFNYDNGIGPEDAGRFLVNVQPVIPFSISEDANVISRTIVPVVALGETTPGGDREFGLGDTVQSLFFSPKAPRPGGIVWGIGPVLLAPTATDRALGGGKFGAGPTGVVLKQAGPWTFGALANHIWSIAGDRDRADVSATFLQPFVNYTTQGATTFFLNTESTYDWRSEAWSVPINAGVNQLFTVGGQRIQVGGGLRYWAESQEGGPEGLAGRINLVFLFPPG